MQKEFRYRNPIYSSAIDAIRDCQIVEDNNRYYLIGTCPPFWEGPNPGVKLYSSDNLLDWRFERFLLKRDAIGEEVWYRDRFWAPEIHRKNKRYYLTFNCRNDQTGFPHSCGIAAADKILGPYEVLTHDRPLIKDANDLTIFTDDDQRSYVFANWPKDICGQEINLESGTLLGSRFACLFPAAGEWDAIGVEGPFVIKRAGIYYLFFSSWTRGYEVGYATAPGPRGPWKKWPGNPFFGAQDPDKCRELGVKLAGDPDSPYIAAGHNAVFKGPDGRDWVVCHYCERGRQESLGFDPIWIEDGTIKTAGPTYTEQTINVSGV